MHEQTELHLRIKYLRQLRQMSVKQLAEKAGVSPSYVYAIEAGTRGSHVQKLSAIAKALGVSLHHILDGDEHK